MEKTNLNQNYYFLSYDGYFLSKLYSTIIMNLKKWKEIFRLHQKPLLKCDICTKNFVFVADLKAHKIERHPLRDFNEGSFFLIFRP